MRFYQEEDILHFDTVHFLFIRVSLSGHIFRITLSRPEKRNAFTPTMAEEITFALAYAHYNPDVRCVLLAAEGPVFCAGADLNAFHDLAADQKNSSLPLAREEIKLGDAFAELHKPCIAQVEGNVLAGGFLLVCGCNFVFSLEEIAFSLPEVKRGLWPMQVMASLLSIMPRRKILEMCITGKTYSAGEALTLGIVTHISQPETIAADVNELADLICRNAPLAIRLGMESLSNLSDIPEREKHSYLKAQLKRIVASDDAQEGINAFKEKRNPVWKGK